mgnify:CR=1 FL=1
MKLKVKITGWNEGKRCSFKASIETPDFEEHQTEFLQRKWLNTVHMQQVEWLNDNYETVIIPLAEERWYWPIEGYEVVNETKKKSKKEQVFEITEVLFADSTDQFKALFLGSLHEQWKTIKHLSPEKIISITMNTMNVASITSTAAYNRMINILSGKENSLETKQIEE